MAGVNPRDLSSKRWASSKTRSAVNRSAISSGAPRYHPAIVPSSPPAWARGASSRRGALGGSRGATAVGSLTTALADRLAARDHRGPGQRGGLGAAGRARGEQHDRLVAGIDRSSARRRRAARRPGAGVEQPGRPRVGQPAGHFIVGTRSPMATTEHPQARDRVDRLDAGRIVRQPDHDPIAGAGEQVGHPPRPPPARRTTGGRRRRCRDRPPRRGRPPAR